MHYIEADNKQQCTMGFSLDELISQNNAVRIIDAIVEEIYNRNKESCSQPSLTNLDWGSHKCKLFNYFKIDCYIQSLPCPHPSTSICISTIDTICSFY